MTIRTDRQIYREGKEAEKLQVSMTTTERQLQIRTALILVIKTVVRAKDRILGRIDCGGGIRIRVGVKLLVYMTLSLS